MTEPAGDIKTPALAEEAGEDNILSNSGAFGNLYDASKGIVEEDEVTKAERIKKA